MALDPRFRGGDVKVPKLQIPLARAKKCDPSPRVAGRGQGEGAPVMPGRGPGIHAFNAGGESRSGAVLICSMSEAYRVTINPEQCGGRPCIRGLRIRVKDVLDLLAAGASREEILKDYPLLEPQDITAALAFVSP